MHIMPNFFSIFRTFNNIWYYYYLHCILYTEFERIVCIYYGGYISHEEGQ